MRGVQKVFRPSNVFSNFSLGNRGMSSIPYMNLIDTIDYPRVTSARDADDLARLESGGFIGLQMYMNSESGSSEFVLAQQEDYGYTQEEFDEMERIETMGRPELVRWMKNYRD